MPWERNVFSSNVQAVGYNEETEELLVTWKNGKVSAYQGVSEETADALSKAPSVGVMLNMEIKGQYAHRYVR